MTGFLLGLIALINSHYPGACVTNPMLQVGHEVVCDNGRNIGNTYVGFIKRIDGDVLYIDGYMKSVVYDDLHEGDCYYRIPGQKGCYPIYYGLFEVPISKCSLSNNNK